MPNRQPPRAASSQYFTSLCLTMSGPCGWGWQAHGTLVQRKSRPSFGKTLSHARTCEALKNAGWSSLWQLPSWGIFVTKCSRAAPLLPLPMMHQGAVYLPLLSSSCAPTMRGPAEPTTSKIILRSLQALLGANSGMPFPPAQADIPPCSTVFPLPFELLLQKWLNINCILLCFLPT